MECREAKLLKITGNFNDVASTTTIDDRPGQGPYHWGGVRGALSTDAYGSVLSAPPPAWSWSQAWAGRRGGKIVEIP